MAKKMKKLGLLMLSVVMGFSMLAGNVRPQVFAETAYYNSERDAMIFSTSNLNGNFNPFYVTTDADKNVVEQTQINMLDVDKSGQLVAGEDYATVVKDFDYEIVSSGDEKKTVYTFVIKNGLKFSDGKPLTMNDVFFNMYEYLDPVYMGSSTMYSVDIEGLSQYRMQSDADEGQVSSEAMRLASYRLLELRDIYEANARIGGPYSSSFHATEEQMREYIYSADVTSAYKIAVATRKQQITAGEAFYHDQLWADYQLTLQTFKEELESDYKAAQECYDVTVAPYNDWSKELSSDVFKFFLYEGYIMPVYRKDNGKDDKTKIEKFENMLVLDEYKTKEEAIERVFEDMTVTALNRILSYWGTSGTLRTLYTAMATSVLLQNNRNEDGSLACRNISGIVSLGHMTDETEVTINDTKYAVAREYNEDGTTKNDNEYAVLQITVNGTNPQAIFGFNFAVAPAHYYSADEQYPNGRLIDIKNNQFGVEWASSDFQNKVIQSKQHTEVPVGAGVYKAVDGETAAFYQNGVVSFQRNEYFYTVGSGLHNAKIKYMQYKEMSSSQVLDALAKGEIHFGAPNYTKEVKQQASKMDVADTAWTWENGYGYIGINAGKIPNVNIRRAIMASMQTSLALEYYEVGTCKLIDWPMSTESWAYPYQLDGVTSKPNGKNYMLWTKNDEENGYASVKAEIQEYMNAAGVTPGDAKLRITFTLVGDSLTNHPTYSIFRQSAEILNSMGWDIKIQADSRALAKFSTGTLEVWAGERKMTPDPDMYQAYHKNSKSPSAYAWGCCAIKQNLSMYVYEYDLIEKLSLVIDENRSAKNQAEIKVLHEKAMNIVLDLAVEMPVYQRSNLIVWNKKVIDSNTLNLEFNTIVGLTDRLWEIDFLEGAELPSDGSSDEGSMDNDSASDSMEESTSDFVEDTTSDSIKESTSDSMEEQDGFSSNANSMISGCGGMIIGGELPILLLLGGALLMAKRKGE